jgi:trehalose 6-phosphate synthase/phosphatase
MQTESEHRLVVVSNRLSVSLQKSRKGLDYEPSVGGLATGLSSLCRDRESLWIGWSGLADEELEANQWQSVHRQLREQYDSEPLRLSKKDLDEFYYGFCNNVIWPLFHYFPTYASYDPDLWEGYRRVNRMYFDKIDEVGEDRDIFWIHDYHLMLLPAMVRERFPRSRIGIFLHLPFPSFELFRLLPWRRQILEGLLGADLIGFHTRDYARHFLDSVARLTELEIKGDEVHHHGRSSRATDFPMGIDYDKYAGALDTAETRTAFERFQRQLEGQKVILSVDRLDYSKGIIERLKAYELFLSRNPQYLGRVTLFAIVAPSRTRVPRYNRLKREINELVGTINGRHGRVGWTPIHYFYRSFPFHRLTAAYGIADVLLVTALRDGMNLISKEYVATRRGRSGVLVLSETAGTADELEEALIVNANDIEQIASTLVEALQMPEKEQRSRNERMHEKLKANDVYDWGKRFLGSLMSADRSLRPSS